MTKTQTLLNEQFNIELYSRNVYLALAACMDQCNFDGFAKLLRAYADEEVGHFDLVIRHLLDRNLPVKFGEIPAPPQPSGALGALELALKTERENTAHIQKLAEAAVVDRDHTAYDLAQHLLVEQIEEEDKFVTLIGRIRASGNEAFALFLIDQELIE